MRNRHMQLHTATHRITVAPSVESMAAPEGVCVYARVCVHAEQRCRIFLTYPIGASAVC